MWSSAIQIQKFVEKFFVIFLLHFFFVIDSDREQESVRWKM